MLDVGSLEMSSRAGVSKTTQIASPRRKTAAPASPDAAPGSTPDAGAPQGTETPTPPAEPAESDPLKAMEDALKQGDKKP